MTLTAWRIVGDEFLDRAFSGEGSRRYGGRWNSRGTAIAYAAESRALAILETLANLESPYLPSDLVLVSVKFDENLAMGVDRRSLPDNWRENPSPDPVKALGDKWVSEALSVVLRVPSSIVPEEHNYLVNPSHPDFPRLHIGTAEPCEIDQRLAKKTP